MIILAIIGLAALLFIPVSYVVFAQPRWKKRPKPIQKDFGLFLDTPQKKTRHLKEHREWDETFYGYCLQPELIVYNGKLMTIDEANGIYFIEEEKRKQNETRYDYAGTVCNDRFGCVCYRSSCSFR